MLETTQNLSESYLISAAYDGNKRVVYLKLYEPKSQKIYFWYDNTAHLPYCLSDLPIGELKKINKLVNHSALDHFETVKKYDCLQDRECEMTKIVAKDPLSVGGRSSNSLRNIIPRAWEANIRYYNCFIYDSQLLMGMPYKIKKGVLVPVDYNPPLDVIKTIDTLFTEEDRHFKAYIEDWAKMLQSPIPNFRRVALDIEVYSSIETRFPDPRKAEDVLIAASFADSDGRKRILLLHRPGVEEGVNPLPSNLEIEYYYDERKMIAEIFRTLLDYPIVLTFNGDNFDLQYLYNRAKKLGFPRSRIPIRLGTRVASIDYGVHIDLYKFFFNRSIQIYAFGKRYARFTLDNIARSIIGEGKTKFEIPISKLNYLQLAEYCLKDADLTLQLTTFDACLVMNLIIILMRISRMTMDDLTRQGVSRWIQNLMYFEHRLQGYLIPRSEDILELKGKTMTEAITKGKKYKGGFVAEPKPGIHFDTAVLDFASLYPSIIKIHNLSYETILCLHDKCRDNKIPGLPYWVCRKNYGFSSLLIGSLRDLRVKWYKEMSRDRTLPKTLRDLYNVLQLTLKVILNASYGVMGAESFNFYCPPVAESITAIGRHVISKTIRKAKSLGIEVVYGDTDSVFLKAPTEHQINKLLGWSEEELKMDLEIDKVYRYTIFSDLKKNYIGVYPDGNVDIKGLTGKKRHMPKFLKTSFMAMINALGEVQSPNDFDKAKDIIKSIVETCYMNLKNSFYSLDDLAFNVMISKPIRAYSKTTPQHVKAATLLDRAGYKIKPGDIISFVKVSSTLGVKPVRLSSLNEININKYIEYMRSTFKQILNAIGIDFDEIIGVTKLESFLWDY